MANKCYRCDDDIEECAPTYKILGRRLCEICWEKATPLDAGHTYIYYDTESEEQCDFEDWD